jgi:hypothetical protein
MPDVLDLQNLAAIRSGNRITEAESLLRGEKAGTMPQVSGEGEREPHQSGFAEFRRRVRTAEVLSPAIERLLVEIGFNGKVSVIIQHGRVLKSGYEEGYFRQPAT